MQEAIHSIFIRKDKDMIIKLDMKNAFDRVKLSFLYQVLLTFGFSLEFVSLIKAFAGIFNLSSAEGIC